MFFLQAFGGPRVQSFSVFCIPTGSTHVTGDMCAGDTHITGVLNATPPLYLASSLGRYGPSFPQNFVFATFIVPT